jgi:transposase
MDRGEQGPAWEDARIAEAFGMSTRSLENWRKQAVEEGPREVLERYYPTRPQCRKLDGQAEAQLVKLACSQAPGERTGWTLTLLANKLVELEVVASISRETVRRTLKKRPQAVAEAAMAHRAGARCRLCVPDGASAGSVLPAVRRRPIGRIKWARWSRHRAMHKPNGSRWYATT